MVGIESAEILVLSVAETRILGFIFSLSIERQCFSDASASSAFVLAVGVGNDIRELIIKNELSSLSLPK